MTDFPHLIGGLKINVRTSAWVPKDVIYVISPRSDEREFIVVGRITPTDVQIFHAVNNWFAEKEKWLVKRQTENAGGGQRPSQADGEGREENPPYTSTASTVESGGSGVRGERDNDSPSDEPHKLETR